MAIRPAYYKLIEECISQIVLHKSGCDPDFRATKRFQVSSKSYTYFIPDTFYACKSYKQTDFSHSRPCSLIPD